MSEPPEQPAADPPPTLAWALLALALIAWGASLATREPTPQTAEAPVPADAGEPEPELPPLPPPPEALPEGLVDADVRAAPGQAAALADRLAAAGVNAALNATGGAAGSGLGLSEQARDASNGLLQPLCNVAIAGVDREDWPARVEEALDGCAEAEARGLFLPRTLGLGISAPPTPGAGPSLLGLDDPRLDRLFEAATRRDLPIVLEVGGPRSWFAPLEGNPDRPFLEAHPELHFHGERVDGLRWPSWEAVFAAFEARVRRHPEATFVVVGWAGAQEDLDRLEALLQAHAGLHLTLGAPRPAPEAVAALVRAHPERVLFGSGLVRTPDGFVVRGLTRDVDDVRRLYTEALEYAEALDLPADVARGVFGANARRVFRLQHAASQEVGAEESGAAADPGESARPEAAPTSPAAGAPAADSPATGTPTANAPTTAPTTTTPATGAPAAPRAPSPPPEPAPTEAIADAPPRPAEPPPTEAPEPAPEL